MNRHKLFSPFCVFLSFFLYISILSAAEPVKYLRPRDLHKDILMRSKTSSRNNLSLPVNFIENKGQAGKEILFYAYMKDSVLEIKKNGLFLIPKDFSSKIDGKNVFKDTTLLAFIGENQNYEIKGYKPLVTKYNYYPDPQRINKFENIRAYESVIYHNVYHHIDLKIYINEGRIEYDWILHPGSKISDIKFSPGDLADMIIDDKGDLRHKSKPDEIIHRKPTSYQLINDSKKTIDSKYVKLSSGSFGFRTEKYDPKYPLFIDPLVLLSSSYIGGKMDNFIESISVDSNGNLYMIGETASDDFPFRNHPDSLQSGSPYIHLLWMARFERDCKTPVYITTFGGDWGLFAKDCKADSHGNLHVFADGPQHGRKYTPYDAIIIILNPAGRLLSKTWIGGDDYEFAGQIEIDKDDNIYISGTTYSSDFYVKNAYQPYIGGLGDIYLIKFTPLCADVIFSTYYGGPDYDLGGYLALDSTQAAYIGAEYMTPNLERFCYRVVKFNPEGRLEYDYWFDIVTSSTTEGYIGITDIAVDAQNRANIVGILPGKFITSDDPNTQDFDAFFYILNPQGIGLDYSTVFSGNNFDIAEAIRINQSGDIYICGTTWSTDFPLVLSLFENVGVDLDGFVMKIDHNTKEIIFSTSFVGSDVDSFKSMDVGADDTVYLGGYTTSFDIPLVNAFQSTTKPYTWGPWGLFVSMKLTDGPVAVLSAERTGGIAPASIQFNSNKSVAIGGVLTAWDWDFGDGSTGSGTEVTHQFADPGEYAVTLTVTDNLGRTSSDKIYEQIYDRAHISAEISLEKDSVKANGKENVKGSLYIRDTSNNSPVYYNMQPVITIDNGNSENAHIISLFHDRVGEGYYEIQFSSGTPGIGHMSITVDNYSLASTEVEYLWPKPPVNISGKATVNRSLTRGYVNRVELQWNANPDQPYPISKYRVYRRYGNNDWEFMAEIPYHIREYTDSAMPSPKNLAYAVTSVDTDGDESEKVVQKIEY
jgi:PKD repeat protein